MEKVVGVGGGGAVVVDDIFHIAVGFVAAVAMNRLRRRRPLLHLVLLYCPSNPKARNQRFGCANAWGGPTRA